MKKHTSMVLTFSALLSLNAFAPQIFWKESETTKRSPASIEEKVMSALGKTPEEKAKEMEAKERDEATSQCLKEKQTKALEAKVKELVEDKELILAELQKEKEKNKKDDDKDKGHAKDKGEKDKKDVVKAEAPSDTVEIMLQLTSFMMSQHQQQLALMQQMFSMLAQSQPQKSQQLEASNYMSPYAFIPSKFDLSSNFQPYDMRGTGQEVGIGFKYQPQQIYSSVPGYMRSPSSQNESGYMNQMQTPYPSPMPHNGFDFSQTPMSDFQRVQF